MPTEVVHPAPKDRIDLFNHPLDRLAYVRRNTSFSLANSAIRFFSFGTNFTRLFPLRPRIAVFEAKKAKLSPFLQIDYPALFFVDLHAEFRQLLPQPSSPPQQPLLRGWASTGSPIVRKPRVLDMRVWPAPRGCNRFLQHPVHLVEIEVAEYRRYHPALRNPLLPSGFQDQLEKPHHRCILDSSRHLRQHLIMPVITPLLSNIVLDELDRELERRRHRHVRYADDCNLYVRIERAGQRVMLSITRFITQRLKLKVNEAKSAVARLRERKFLGFSFTDGPEIRRAIAPKAVVRFKDKIREITRQAKGISIETTVKRLATYMVGWRGYFGFCETPRC